MNYYNEFDKKTAAWLRELIKAGLIPPGEVDERSITDVRAGDLKGFAQCHFFAGIGGWPYALKLAGWPEDRPVWTGSPPCQPFSTAGEKKMSDDRRHLWPELMRIFRERQPSTIFVEQVAGKSWRELCAVMLLDLETCSYAVAGANLDAFYFRAHHRRKRLYIVAHATGQRQSQPRVDWSDTGNQSSDCFGEADRLVDAVQRKSLPFLCGRHDGLPKRMAELACKGFGNAIVPQVAAEFIKAYLEINE